MTSTNGFTEAELNEASLAGINKFALEVAKEYPDTGFGHELRKHIDWGNVNQMAEHRREEGEEASPEQFWLGGYFSTRMAFGTLETAFSAAYPENKRIIYDVHGSRLERQGIRVPDRVKADVNNGNVLADRDPEEVPADD